MKLILFWISTMTLCNAQSVLPNKSLTPGIADPSVSAEQLRHPSFIRKRRNVPLAEKKLVLQRYGIPWSQHRLYEIDHDLPLCLGGMNNDQQPLARALGGALRGKIQGPIGSLPPPPRQQRPDDATRSAGVLPY